MEERLPRAVGKFLSPNQNVTEALHNRRQDPPSTEEDHRSRFFEDCCEEADSASFRYRLVFPMDESMTDRGGRGVFRSSRCSRDPDLVKKR